ncbi:MAG: DUF6285 domain-containing protein [Hyphomonadaceae bacterium]|nr:DUF6285 domain-containing protein [Hyphomonadaceae bacterium]
MSRKPTAEELVAAVRLFLKETVRPQLEGHAAFHTKVAENALAIVARELAQGEAAEQAAIASARALLGTDEEDLDQLTRRLCEAIRTGEISLATPGLLTHLRTVAVNQLNIDQPKYSGLALATKS